MLTFNLNEPISIPDASVELREIFNVHEVDKDGKFTKVHGYYLNENHATIAVLADKEANPKSNLKTVKQSAVIVYSKTENVNKIVGIFIQNTKLPHVVLDDEKIVALTDKVKKETIEKLSPLQKMTLGL